MKTYVIKRILTAVLTLLVITFLLFVLVRIMPGNPFPSERMTDEAIAAKREEMGLNDPFFTRYVRYVRDACKLDFGESYRTHKPVFNEIFSRLPTSLKLSLVSMIFACLLGIPLGVYSAMHQYSVPDQILRVTSMFFIAVPPFWFAMMLMLVFALNLHWVPTSGSSTWQCYILPITQRTV